ncbi:aconitate hydratase [Desulfovibrio litoralis]|uniref:Aconitate hydratase A n=1 Tax=Desulfovibrio litoralis DSM 11393 TaxID=1121455 RepID=A0A1M7SFQ8_9BACT|nr:aconitate hydratase [Desulfovibrio litoralis]SHN57250.1 aconitase [Desulfovibrio litoralis DSM 11393]
MNITKKIISAHLMSGKLEDFKPGDEIALKMDQTITQDATGTMTYLQFEAMGIPKVKTDLSVSYVDHNTLQQDFRNPDDHQFLRTIAAKYGLVYSPAGLGICHQLHLENFAKPGATLIGADSHTPTAGGMGSLAMGAGGLSVALAMAGAAYKIPMPKVVKVELTGKLKGWASAKDVILALLKILTVKGGVGRVFEFTGEGVSSLSVPERACITNMGAELGATTSIFPSDERTKAFLKAQGREQDYKELKADANALYDESYTIELDKLVPMVACPHMPDKVKAVAELAGLKVDQVAIGSCTNSSFSDLSAVALIWKGKQVDRTTDTLVSPGSKQVLRLLARENLLDNIIDSGARILECACGPCIGMGGAPISKAVSVRTFNRNFEGRSGTKDASVYLVSPLVAAKLALDGKFSDPKTWGEAPKMLDFPDNPPSIRHLFIDPSKDDKERSKVEILRGPNIVALEVFDVLPQNMNAKVSIKLGDDITTDHIMPAGAAILPLRSNIPAISEYVFSKVDSDFVKRAKEFGTSVIVAGHNYGQGSSREHAALAPRHLGIRAVIAKSFARIHKANLANFGILALTFANPDDYDKIEQCSSLGFDFSPLFDKTKTHASLTVKLDNKEKLNLNLELSDNELEMVLAGGLLNQVRANKA